MFTIETTRLILRDLLETDLEPFFKLASDPQIIHFQTYIRNESKTEARDWLEKASAVNRETPRKGYHLALLRKTNREWLGWLGFGPAEDPSLADIEFGYAVSREHWGCGYASEAVEAVVGFCFEQMYVRTVFGECERENFASRRVMEKNGLSWHSDYFEIDEDGGAAHEMQRFMITHKQWEARSGTP